MSLGIIIQARTGSTRLPGKMIQEFHNGLSLLEVILIPIKEISEKLDLPFIVATSDDSKDDDLAKLVSENGVKLFRGSENDVLKRFIGAAELYDLDKIIRICGDNPFIQISELERLIENFGNSTVDYMSFKVDGDPSILTHFGFWTEGVSIEALRKVFRQTSEVFYHEHVTNFIYNNPDSYKIEWLPTDEIFEGRKDIRLTIDTIEDFEISKFIYQTLSQNNLEISILGLFKYLDSNAEILNRMKQSIKRNKK